MGYSWRVTTIITNQFLYGQDTTPGNLVNESLIRPDNARGKITIDAASMMNDGPGRYAFGAKSSLVATFMNGASITGWQEGIRKTYRKEELAKEFGIKSYGINIQQLSTDPFSDDYIERVYIYNNQRFLLADDVQFVIEADGTRHIENFAVIPRNRDDNPLYQDDFDFKTSGGLQQYADSKLEDWIDPDKIGRTVDIKYDNLDGIQKINYTQADYAREQSEINQLALLALNPLGYEKLGVGMLTLANVFWNNGTTHFVDSQGRAIIYGTDGNNSLSYGKVKSLNFLSPMYLKTSESDGVVLIGGKGTDTLIGTSTADSFLGGTGFDRYIAGDGDTLKDSDGKGLVRFGNIDLTGKKYKNKQTGLYEDDDYIYNGNPKSTKGTLTVTSKNGSKSITIQNWNTTTKEGLGIKLAQDRDIDVSITKSATAMEGNSGKRSLSFTVTLSRALEDGESLKVSVSSTDEGSYTFTSGEKSHTFTHSWYGDTKDEGTIDHIATLTPTASYSGPYTGVKVKVLNSGTATVYDDDEISRHDPLALDMNMDGFISTTALETSGTYFDITGDGLKERVGWISPVDALLTYDKNENGQIDGIDEVFGNANESGFEELKRTIDSNHDNKIDRRDELFAQLQVWNDLNQDGEAQPGELQSLSEAGITSIDLNYVSSNININGNLLTEASKYTTTLGNKELATDAKVNASDIPGFSVDESTKALPQLKGSGLVYDAFILYNTNNEFKALSEVYAINQIQRKAA